MHDHPLIACPDCDLMQTEPTLPMGGQARCVRCGTPLFKRNRNSIERASALAISASIFFLLANFFPLVGLQVQGSATHTTLIGAVKTLMDQGKLPIAALVFITTILVPAIELTLMNYILIPLRRDRVPRPRGRCNASDADAAALGHGRGLHARHAGLAGEAVRSRAGGDRHRAVMRWRH